MGLDQYAYTAPKELVGDQQVDIEGLSKNGCPAKGVNKDFFYWRKFNALQGWMKELYHQKGGTDESFNCATVRVDQEDLDQLEEDIQNERLVPVEGFFFGSSEIFPEDIESLKDFIQKARQAIEADQVVIYDSWW